MGFIILLLTGERIQLPGISIVLSIGIAILGFILYLAVKKVEVKEIGRICFWVGLLAFLLSFR